MNSSGHHSEQDERGPAVADPMGSDGPTPTGGQEPRDPHELENGEGPREKEDGPLSGLGADMGQRVKDLDSRLDTLAVGLDAQGNRLRDAERALVDRIADVDDDRRRTQTQLQRALQSQTDEVSEALRRLAGLSLLGLLMIAVLAAGGLYLLHYLHQRDLAELQGKVMGELQTMGLELDRIKSKSVGETQAQGDLNTPSENVDRLAAELAEIKEVLETKESAPSPDMAKLTEEIARLKSSEQGLISGIQALREAAATAAAATPTSAQAEVSEPPPQTPKETPGPEDATDQTAGDQDNPPGAPAPTEAETPAAQPLEPDGPDVDETATQTPVQASPGERPFALQLMGTYDRDGLLAFAARPDLPASVFIREERLRGRPWFVLIHSLYPSYAEAESARDSLPEDLSKLDTWIRRLPADAQLQAIPTGRVP